MATLFCKKVAHYFHADSGKRVSAAEAKTAPGKAGRLRPGYRRQKVTLPKWYATYNDADGLPREVPLATDQDAAQTMLAELVKRAERRRAGYSDPFEDQRKRPLAGGRNGDRDGRGRSLFQ